MMVRKIGVVIAGAALVLTAACGGGGGDRPSTSDIAKALKDKGGSQLGLTGDSSDAINCIAKVLEGSKISDSGIKALIKGDSGYKPSKTDEAQVAVLTPKIEACAK
ncbi:MAG TPA: hypothetical protein VFE15_11535 [Marmoricola sp.]|jgi:hypothetical protein|nr:hypothetical protein [Marmoricola sp.]